ncbi:MAG: 16S rRNA (guanine(527)-N(7))-methyltransferase RsmG, partial [Pseudomonadota bacterium]
MNSGKLYDFLNSVHPVSRETMDRLDVYVSLLIQWQKKTNLIAPSTLDEIWERHIADSLQILALKPDARHWLDLGSGGGFPGLVIAACMAENEKSTVTLVESNNKKTAFLRQANRA